MTTHTIAALRRERDVLDRRRRLHVDGRDADARRLDDVDGVDADARPDLAGRRATTAPMVRATRSPAGARRSTVIAAVTTA